MKRFAMAALLAAALAAPLFSSAAVAQDVRLSSDENWHSVIVPPGGSIVLSLPENMSTGLSWKVRAVEGEGVQVTGEEHAQDAAVPGAPGTFNVRLTAGATGVSRVTVVESRGYEKPAQEYMVFLHVAPLPADQKQAATVFADHSRRLQCELNKQFIGQVDNVFIVDGFVLATWSCGRLHGEDAFKLDGMHAGSKSQAKVADVGYDVHIDTEGLLWLGADRAQAFELLKLRRAAGK